jgi:predicted nucleic acid-binding protein
MAAIVLLDANVLYPAPLRDLLLQLSYSGLFQARWSADIDEEWRRNLLSARPELEAQVAATQAMMRRAMPDALVTGYADRIPRLVLPDPDDRHVLAAAITAAAEVIVTFNLKDFPAATLAAHGLEAQHPDTFLSAFIDMAPLRVLACVRECLSRLSRPPVAPSSYLNIMSRLGLTETVAFLRKNPGLWEP